ncbi:MAG TPA: DUF5709 domain-containing protein [Trebonia sp.]
MPDSEYPHEEGVWDLDENEVLDASDTLDGDPGDDPLDRGIAEPEHYSAAFRHARDGDEDHESLDDLLAEEEPEAGPGDESWDENATSAEIAREERALGADPRSGRLVARDEDLFAGADGTSVTFEDQLVALDVGIDGGAATAEEAAVHLVDGDMSETEDE